MTRDSRINIGVNPLSFIGSKFNMNFRDFAKFVFLSTTVLFAGVILYTANFYYGVYIAVRSLEIAVEEFDINVINSTDVRVKVALTLKNPSSQSFRITEINELLFLDEQPILSARASTPPEVAPHSNVEVLILSSVPSSTVHLVTQGGQKTYFLYTLVTLRGPLVGQFRLTSFDYFTK